MFMDRLVGQLKLPLIAAIGKFRHSSFIKLLPHFGCPLQGHHFYQCRVCHICADRSKRKFSPWKCWCTHCHAAHALTSHVSVCGRSSKSCCRVTNRSPSWYHCGFHYTEIDLGSNRCGNSLCGCYPLIGNTTYWTYFVFDSLRVTEVWAYEPFCIEFPRLYVFLDLISLSKFPFRIPS